MPIEPRRYSLDENSHPMDWFTAFMPMTPEMNREDAAAANVKGDRTTKFAVSNWTADSNAKAMLCNAGASGHIFSGKFKPFSNQDIMAMIGVYIIDGLAPSPQLTQKMQSQIQQPTHGNDRIVAVMGTGWQQKHRSFRHFCIPGCYDAAPSKKSMPELQSRRALLLAASHLEGGMGVGKGFLE